VEFTQTAHVSKWTRGTARSASDALNSTTSIITESIFLPTSRIHYHIQDGGQVVNVVPDYAKLSNVLETPKGLTCSYLRNG
jgi:aminobenzoyl-glutamate utilization protein B